MGSGSERARHVARVPRWRPDIKISLLYKQSLELLRSRYHNQHTLHGLG